MNKKGIVGLVALTLMSISITGCSSAHKKTGIGAGAGAATGAVVGGIAGGWKGAAIGAAVGGVTGGVVGNVLDRQSKELAQVADTKRTAEGILVNLKNDLLFETNSAALKPQANTGLVQLAKILVKYPQDQINIQGYTDNVGKDDYNQELSLKRAEAVKYILVANGVTQDQISTTGKGEEAPIASNTTKQGRSQNRRVELHIQVPEEASS